MMQKWLTARMYNTIQWIMHKLCIYRNKTFVGCANTQPVASLGCTDLSLTGLLIFHMVVVVHIEVKLRNPAKFTKTCKTP